MSTITDEHPKYLGKLVANIQSLEYVLRAFLINDEITKGFSFTQSANLNDIKLGDVVPENAFTKYETLKRIIKKYNSHPKIRSKGLTIDESLIDIRDAIAHGRVSS